MISYLINNKQLSISDKIRKNANFSSIAVQIQFYQAKTANKQIASTHI